MNKTSPFYFYYLLQRGEVCLVAVTLSVAGIGDLLDILPRNRRFATVCGGFAALTAFASSAFFAFMNVHGNGVDGTTINYLSGTMLAFGALAGIGCHACAGLSR